MSKYTVSITKHNRTPIKFRPCEKNSTLLSMSDNYVHCTMLFEFILSLLLQSKETFCHLLVKCCFWLSSAVLRRELPCVTMSNFQCFHTSHTILWTLREATSSSRTASVSAFRFLSCFTFSVAPSE